MGKLLRMMNWRCKKVQKETPGCGDCFRSCGGDSQQGGAATFGSPHRSSARPVDSGSHGSHTYKFRRRSHFPTRGVPQSRSRPNAARLPRRPPVDQLPPTPPVARRRHSTAFPNPVSRAPAPAAPGVGIDRPPPRTASTAPHSSRPFAEREMTFDTIPIRDHGSV